MNIKIESSTDAIDNVKAANAADKPVDGPKADIPAPSEPKAEKEGETIEDSGAAEKETEDIEAEPQDDTEDEEKEELQAKDEKKPKNGFKKRIDKLNKRATKAEQEAEYWRKLALEKEKTQETQPQDAQKPLETKANDGRPKAEDFETHDDYIEALTDWKLEQRDKQHEVKQRQTQMKTEYEKKVEAHKARVIEYAKANTEYQDLVNGFIEEHGDVKFSPSLEDEILTSESGPAIIQELLKNPEEFSRLNTLGPLAVAREIGKIEARLSRSSTEAARKEPKTTKAPPPITPVGSKASGVKKSLYDPNLSQREYEQLRAEQIAARRA